MNVIHLSKYLAHIEDSIFIKFCYILSSAFQMADMNEMGIIHIVNNWQK